MDERSKYLRRLVVRALEGGDRGHVGASMSLVEIMRVLYDDIAVYESSDPRWPLRDRIILSKGHGCLAQYALLADKGFFPVAALDKFCRYERLDVPVPPQYSPDDGVERTHDLAFSLGGHPDPEVPGIEATTGALGHGLAIGVGMALAIRRWWNNVSAGNPERNMPRVFVIMGDGELGEGSVWEAAMHAAKHQLSNLVAIIDANGLQSAGETVDISGNGYHQIVQKFYGFGWGYRYVDDGHDVGALRTALSFGAGDDRPLAVVAKTVKGKGIPFAENNLSWHHKNNFSADEIAAMKAALA